ncbi:MAG: sulfite exporter TauE/SafE family protein [Pseudorhodobacter sp.]|nr:sulfite exporter TauE/SafE family protein [Pseudorhodobacter sp.]
MDGGMFWAVAVLAAVLVGMGKGGLPVVGILSVPLLSLVVSPVLAAGLLLPIYVISDMFGLWAYRRDFNGRVLAILMPGMTLGVSLGWATASLVPDWLVAGIIGVIGTTFALSLILRRGPAKPARVARVGPGLLWGTATGFTSFVSHAGAPPYQVYVLPLRLEKTVFAGTSTIAFAYVNAIKLIPYWALGQLSPDNLRVAAVLAVPAALSVFAGVWLVRILPERRFFQLVTWVLLAVSLRLIWQAVSRGLGG